MTSLIPRLQKVSKLIFDQPLFYHGLRSFFLGGLPSKTVLELLDPQSDEIILDVGCGSGILAERMPFKRYYGYDWDKASIGIAQKRGIPNAVFNLGDIRQGFQTESPDKAVLWGVLHHLDDTEAVQVLDRLAGLVSKGIVTGDPVYSKYHFLNNALCRLDRGKFVRTEEEMLQLVGKTKLKIAEKRIYYSNTKIAKYIGFRLIR